VDQTVIAGKSANRIRWQMGASTALPYLGLPDAFHTGSDVTVRPAYAEWQGADAYLSLHSNSSGSTTDNASGTSTYRYNCNAFPDHSAAPDPALCDDPPGSDALQRTVHSAIIDILRLHWDPNWRDRGPRVANFGELRVLDSIPGALVESAFHDGIYPAADDMRMADNEALQDPRFRHWLGYALYAGLARFFDPDAVLLPESAPLGLSASHGPESGILVEWQEVAGALGYRLRWGIEGLDLSHQLVTQVPSVLIENMEAGALVSLQVSALNAGGEGPPSELATVRYRGHGVWADVLLVSGFDRQDARIGEARNRRDQAWAHAQAIRTLADRNVYFDFAANESVGARQLSLAGYRAVIWILGEESTADETFDREEQQLVTSYLDAGGSMMATGAEIGWDLSERGDVEDAVFLADAFGVAYQQDDANTFLARGTGSMTTLNDFAFDDGSAGIYPVEFPDVFVAAAAESILEYDNGLIAGVSYDRDPGLSLLIGFPFETIVDADSRRDLMDLCLAFLLPGHTPDDFDSDGLPDDWEDDNGTDPARSSADEDPDEDGRSNLQEYQEGTDPQVSDLETDGGVEIDAGVETDGGNSDANADITNVGDGCGCHTTPTNPAFFCWPLLFWLWARKRPMKQ